MTTPARTYYEACEGVWHSGVSFAVTDGEALARSGMSWSDRALLHLLSRWPSWLGSLTMDTAVELDPDPRVVRHRTVVRWLGLPLKRSVETFTLDPDGRRLTVSGGMTGEAEVDPTGTRASYTLRWLGVTIRQQTTRGTDQVTLHQEGPGFRASQVLARRR